MSNGAYLPIEPHFPADRITRTLSRAGCRLVLTESGSTAMLDEALEKLPGVEKLLIDVALGIELQFQSPGETGHVMQSADRQAAAGHGPVARDAADDLRALRGVLLDDLPVIVGIEEGLFEAAGLDVRFSGTYADREKDRAERPVMSRTKEQLFECGSADGYNVCEWASIDRLERGRRAGNIAALRAAVAAQAILTFDEALQTPRDLADVPVEVQELTGSHYCALQNAPILQFQKSDKPGELKFVFLGGTNFDPKVDAHLHESTFQIIDKDTVEQRSTVFANGKANPELKAVLHRQTGN